ncbi:MAG: SiaB family protein kinase [Defluviitaleaceae bacterium]|nr:SiaB family protein kinase [Defluviitaleaceae bacterium]
MALNLKQYSEMLKENSVQVVYSGPIWSNGIASMADMLIKRLEYDDMPFRASQAVFSVFVEQINNMMMYTAEKEVRAEGNSDPKEMPMGIFVLGIKENNYFIQTGNLVSNANAEILKSRIDHLNSLDKESLRKYHKTKVREEDNNKDSKGAGLGLIVLARQTRSPMKYEFVRHDDEHQYFSLYLDIR